MSTSSLHDAAFTFWSLFTTEQALMGQTIALANTSVPYYLSNAAWHPEAEHLERIAQWYAARQLPPALVVAPEREEELELALRESPFLLERSFAFRPAAESSTDSVVEQVDWRQARYAGDLLARHYDQPDLALSVVSSLVQVMQQNSSVQAFLSYGDDPVGTMLTFEQDSSVTAMLLVDGDGGLEGRLARDAARRGLSAFVLEMLPEGVTASGGLERWSII